jgi:hypothetical protein
MFLFNIDEWSKVLILSKINISDPTTYINLSTTLINKAQPESDLFKRRAV